MATVTVEAQPVGLSEAHELQSVKKVPTKSPSTSSEQQQEPTGPPKVGADVYFKIVATGLSFFVSGINDGSVGALMPYFIREYNLNIAVVSTVSVPAHRFCPEGRAQRETNEQKLTGCAVMLPTSRVGYLPPSPIPT